MTLRRGFRAETERTSVAIRDEMGLEESDSVNVRDVAEHLKIAVVDADELVERKRLEELESIQAYAFSACTFDIEDSAVIVVNPLHPKERQVSDIAHEMAHVILKHELTEIREIAGVPFRTCRSDQEEEATTWGGTLLLPRPLLLEAARNGMSIEDIATSFGVTVDMARFRFNTTGVARQAAYARSRRAKGTA